jgi:S1-C subfamily serine protease
MKKAPLYSRSRAGARIDETLAAASAPPPPAPPTPPGRMRRFKDWLLRHERRLWPALVVLLIGAYAVLDRPSRLNPPLTAKQVDHLVRQSLEEKPLPSKAAKAYEAVAGSVVRVVGLMDEKDDGSDKEDGKRERGVGTGVVVIDNGTILTNLHVVSGAKKILVTFADGLESEAQIVGLQAEHDLAVLRARKIPDDLHAATLRGTGDLRPGDEVMAVGFPFGIGPSASTGVVSGLKREFRSPEGERTLTNLIQFDAAANPGNSGGPLVTMEGEVVGIVTAILNPNRQRVFIGIGFAVPIENAAAGAGMPPF